MGLLDKLFKKENSCSCDSTNKAEENKSKCNCGDGCCIDENTDLTIKD